MFLKVWKGFLGFANVSKQESCFRSCRVFEKRKDIKISSYARSAKLIKKLNNIITEFLNNFGVRKYLTSLH